MKWVAAVFGAFLYLVWPYYMLVEFSRALQSRDVAAINSMVDWPTLRTNVKAQFQEKIDAIPTSSGGQMFGNALALTFANSLIDKMLTPAGLTALMESTRSGRPPSKPVQQVKQSPGPETRPNKSFYEMVKFAFFVTPIHFRLDLADPNGSTDSLIAIILTFKGTGWQLTNVKVPDIGQRLNTAQRG